MQYELRTETGTLIAKLDPGMTREIFTRAMGGWRAYTPKNGETSRAFVLAEDSTLVTPWGIVYLWTGYKIIEV